MQENNEILQSLLMEMKIKTHFEGKDRYITLKLSDLQNFCIRLLELGKNGGSMNDKEEQMILDNLALIYHVIKQLNLNWETEDEWQDYYDSGLIGLIKGVKAFEDNKGLKPSTFLIPCIKNEIRHHITGKNRKKRFNEYGRTISLDLLLGENENIELAEYVQDPRINIEEQVERKIELETIIHKINSMKSIKQALVLKMYFGLEGFTERNFKEISKILKVSQQCIRKRFIKGLQNLKESMKKELE